MVKWIPIEEFKVEAREPYFVATNDGDVTVAVFDANPYYGDWHDLIRRASDGDTTPLSGAVTHIIPFPKHPDDHA
jgi:hypothetical protein